MRLPPGGGDVSTSTGQSKAEATAFAAFKLLWVGLKVMIRNGLYCHREPSFLCRQPGGRCSV